MASATSQLDLITFISPVSFKLFKFYVFFPTQWNWAIIGFGRAFHLMRNVLRELERFVTRFTFKHHVINAVDHEPVYCFTGNKILAAIWARLRFFCPLTHTFFAAQFVA